jgi:hypothetical protein
MVERRPETAGTTFSAYTAYVANPTLVCYALVFLRIFRFIKNCYWEPSRDGCALIPYTETESGRQLAAS